MSWLEQSQKAAHGHDGDALHPAQTLQVVFIPRDEILGGSGKGSCEDEVVVGVGGEVDARQL